MLAIPLICALAIAGDEALPLGVEAEPRRPTATQLVAQLDASEKATRDEAIVALTRLDPEEVWSAVKPLLRADQEETRRAVVRLIREMEIGAAVSAICRTLRSDTDAKVRREAAHAITDLDPERAVGELRTAAFLDREIIVRRAAIQDLGRIGSLEAAWVLYEVLEEAVASGDTYFSALAQRSLTLATGKSFGANLEGWRHWIDGQRTDDGAVIDSPEKH